MTNISLDLSNKIPNEIIEIIKAVNNVADGLNISTFLIGATARDLVLEYGYGLPKSRATRDIDFGVAVGSWSEYDALKQTLIQTKRFHQDANVEHRIYEILTSTEIDIVPFGGIESPQSQIIWQKSEKQMNTSGFAEAYESALDVRLSKDLVVKIVSPVGMTILKIIAWNDRSSNKDSSDLWLIVKNYLNIGDNQDRIYNDYSEWLDESDYDYEITGAKLLGVDIAGISSEDTKSNIQNILEDEKKMKKLSLEIARFESRIDDNFPRVLKIMQKLKDGINEKS